MKSGFINLGWGLNIDVEVAAPSQKLHLMTNVPNNEIHTYNSIEFIFILEKDTPLSSNIDIEINLNHD